MRRLNLILFFVLGLACQITAQAQESLKPFSQINIQPHIGSSWQSTLFKPVFDFSFMPEFISRPYPIQYEKGTQGFGLDLGTTATINISAKDNIGIRPNARLRYDYVYGLKITAGSYNEEVKAFLIDLSTHFVYTHRSPRNKELMASIGYTLNQLGKEYVFDVRYSGGSQHSLRKFQYPSINFGLAYDFFKISEVLFVNGSIMANYIPHGHPAFPDRDFMSLGFGLSVRYKPEFLVFKLRK